MKKVSILIILPSLAAGGAEKVTISFIENLDKNIYNVHLILLNANGPLKLKIKKNVYNLKSTRLRSGFLKLINKIRSINPDIIFSTFPHITLPILLIKRWLPNQTYIISREPNMVNSSLKYSSFSFILKSLHKLCLPSADKIIVNSSAMLNDLIIKGFDKNKLLLVHNPVDDIDLRKINNFIRHPGEGLRLVGMGRLVYQKGFDRIIPILQNLNKIHLTILGEGPDYNNLRNIVKELNLESKVKFMGYTKYPKNYIAAADYFILPSRWEGLPNAVLESLVLGTPVLSFKEVEGLVDIIPNVEKNKLYLCKNENEMELLLKKLPIRDDNKNLALRKNLLKKFNTPSNYSQIISKSIKEILL